MIPSLRASSPSIPAALLRLLLLLHQIDNLVRDAQVFDLFTTASY
jgi:hypothetical protein